MSDYIDLDKILTWQQAIVVIVGILVVLGLPQIINLVQTLRLKRSVTKNNGGGSVKDQQDRMETMLKEQGEKLDKHLTDSRGSVRPLDDLLQQIGHHFVQHL